MTQRGMLFGEWDFSYTVLVIDTYVSKINDFIFRPTHNPTIERKKQLHMLHVLETYDHPKTIKIGSDPFNTQQFSIFMIHFFASNGHFLL